MFVLSADVRHSLLRGMRLPVADASGVGGLDSMKEKGDRLLERFGGTSRNSAAISERAEMNVIGGIEPRPILVSG